MTIVRSFLGFRVLQGTLRCEQVPPESVSAEVSGHFANSSWFPLPLAFRSQPCTLSIWISKLIVKIESPRSFRGNLLSRASSCWMMRRLVGRTTFSETR